MFRSPQILPALASLILTVTSAHAEDDAARREDQFKAAYLFNFVKFVEWPPSVASETLMVCFVGANGVYDALVTGIESKRVGTRRLLARQLEPLASIDNCNALYLDAASASSQPSPTEAPVLTISDAQEFAAHGGMIQLFTDKNRLRFSINVDSAHKAGLRISSDLLKLAAAVQRSAR